jgi:hypothetical protein
VIDGAAGLLREHHHKREIGHAEEEEDEWH